MVLELIIALTCGILVGCATDIRELKPQEQINFMKNNYKFITKININQRNSNQKC